MKWHVSHLHTTLSNHIACFADCQIQGIDLVFVLDASGRIRRNFNLIKRFATEIVLRLNVSSEETRVGLIVYGRRAQVEFDTLEHTTQQDLLLAFDRVEFDRVSKQKVRHTNTAAALNLLVSSFEEGKIELRDGHRHVAIVVSDRRSDDSDLTSRNAAALHAANLYQEVYAVGVGKANITELGIIASDPSRVLFDRNFDLLAINQLQRNITLQLCSKYSLIFALHN